jgi:hypothetical protein
VGRAKRQSLGVTVSSRCKPRHVLPSRPASFLESDSQLLDRPSSFPPRPLRAAIAPLVLSLLGLLGLGAWIGGVLPWEVGGASVTAGGFVLDDRPFVESITVRDTSGVVHRVGGRCESPATVVVYLSSTCPISLSYQPMLRRLQLAASRRGVEVLVIGVDDGVADLLAGRIPVISESDDPAHSRLRDVLEPTHVPESFVIDGSGRLCYRGRIDDRYIEVGRRRTAVTSRDMVRAIDTVLGGRSRTLLRTNPVGCLLEPLSSSSDPGPASDRETESELMTWSGGMASLVHRRCGGCHRAGTAAPFSLSSYADVSGRRSQVFDVITRRIMPPWKPRAGFGHFQDDLRLRASELSAFRAWLESGLPTGDLSLAEKPREYPGGWSLGEPDLVLRMSERVSISSEGPDIYWYFVIPSGLKTDRMISAIEFRPGNARVVHHASFRYDDTGRARRLDAADPVLGYRRFGGWGFRGGGTLGGWAVGVQPRRLASGLGRRIVAGSDFVLQVHYHPTGRVETDRSELGIYFVRDGSGGTGGRAERITAVDELLVGDLSLEIPAGEPNWYHRAEYTVPVDVTVHSVLPHMHLLGRRCRSWAETPAGRRLALVAIDDWDFNWHSRYHLLRPLRFPAGTRVVHEAWYDNSESNPFNPHSPPRRVIWGEGTQSEMGVLFLDVTVESESDRLRLLEHNKGYCDRQARRLIGRVGTGTGSPRRQARVPVP